MNKIQNQKDLKDRKNETTRAISGSIVSFRTIIGISKIVSGKLEALIIITLTLTSVFSTAVLAGDTKSVK